ncbi:MAG: Gfo/Idh/MocA family oxidoreductase [Bryobacterales bacterium]|nr:Gfo/Idh/MocA family oxidoreductase [Bryobacterales bacterium]
MERRTFLHGAAWTAASFSRVAGANSRVNIGLIGCGGRGSLDARLIRGTPDDIRAVAPDNYHEGKLDPRLQAPSGVEITALCDVIQERLNRARQWAPAARTYADFRQLLEARDVDAVVIATPDHWHAIMTILACQAGKDIYLEKPVMYSIREAKPIREAVRRHERILQIGTQHRAADHIAEASRIIRSGRIGEVYFVRVWNYLNMGKRRPQPDAPAPPGLDWDFWLGPAPKVPFNPDRLSYRNFMAYTNGLISDYGMHRFDSVHQIMGVDAPLTVSSSWGRFQTVRMGDLPDIHQATYEYPGFILSYECCTVNSHGLGGRAAGMRYYGARGPEDRPHGMAFYGTEAALFVDRIGMELYPEPKAEGVARRGQVWEPRMKKFQMNEDEPTPLHCRIFVDNVRSRKKPFADIDVGCRSTIAPLLGNIAARTGRKLKWDAAGENFPGDAEANALLFRPYRKPWDLVRIG